MTQQDFQSQYIQASTALLKNVMARTRFQVQGLAASAVEAIEVGDVVAARQSVQNIQAAKREMIDELVNENLDLLGRLGLSKSSQRHARRSIEASFSPLRDLLNRDSKVVRQATDFTVAQVERLAADFTDELSDIFGDSGGQPGAPITPRD